MNNRARNVIIISIDNLRADGISANPDRKLLRKLHLRVRPHTPGLDWFVRNGTFFNNCITAAPYTTAAHAAILTGRWPAHNGMQEFFSSRLRAKTIFNILAQRGYATLFQTDFPFLLGPALNFVGAGEKFIAGEELESFAWIKRNTGKPTACFFHFANVHSPYGYYNLRWGGNDFRRRVRSLLDVLCMKPVRDSESRFCIFQGANREEIYLFNNYREILYEMHRRKMYREIMDLYFEGINYFERKRFGRFMARLIKMNLFSNSLIVVLSDHGELWDKETRGHNDRQYDKNILSDDVIKVPLIFLGPGVPKRRIIDYQVRTIDVVPTILSILGEPYKKREFDGTSLFPFNRRQSKKNAAYSQVWGALKNKNMRKLISSANVGKKLIGRHQENFLNQECVRYEGWKLSLVYNAQGLVVGESFAAVDYRGQQDKAVPSAVVKNKLRHILNDFKFRSAKIKRDGSASVSDKEKQKIALMLKNIGYNI